MSKQRINANFHVQKAAITSLTASKLNNTADFQKLIGNSWKLLLINWFYQHVPLTVFLKLALTIGDLAGSEHIQTPHLTEAILYRKLDRNVVNE